MDLHDDLQAQRQAGLDAIGETVRRAKEREARLNTRTGRTRTVYFDFPVEFDDKGRPKVPGDREIGTSKVRAVLRAFLRRSRG